ncbi:hypothetical protein BT69DRAFT_957403 [Atractiella rhizophila]|nr:hypothetical protein BT69DRAFT_957403 [Atractiella rhizophila]
MKSPEHSKPTSRRSRDFALFKTEPPPPPQINTDEFPPFPSSSPYYGPTALRLALPRAHQPPPTPPPPAPPPHQGLEGPRAPSHPPNTKRMAAPTPSQKLTIRPPPHVDFVQGFPGVPPLPYHLADQLAKGSGPEVARSFGGYGRD